MPGSLFPESVGWGEVVDSLLMGTGWRVESVFVSHEGRVGVWVAGAAGDTHTAEKLCPRASGSQGEVSPWGCRDLPVLRPSCSRGGHGVGHGDTLSS